MTNASAIALSALLLSAQAQAQEKLTVFWVKGFYKAEDDALYEAIAKYEKKSGIKVDLVAGTSAGSLVAALYASGKSSQELRRVADTPTAIWLTPEAMPAAVQSALQAAAGPDLPVEMIGTQELRRVSLAIFDVDRHWIPERGDEPGHWHHDLRFLLEADRDAPLVVSSESKDLAWVALDDLPRYNGEQSIVRMARKTRLLC